MARKTKVITICDLHRGEVEATGTVEITINGERRTLDVCAEHLAEIRKSVRPWLGRAASGTSKRARKTTKKSKPRRNVDGAAIRAWAAKNGHDLPARGRIPAAVREAYEAAKK